MISRAIARYIRISPRKTRKVADLIRNMPVVKAEAVLDTINKRPTIYIKRLLTSALDSADKKSSVVPADLYISRINVDQGPMLKRYRAASMGRATMIKHRTSHIILELDRIKRQEKKPVETEKIKKATVKTGKTEKVKKASTKKPAAKKKAA